MYTTIRWVVHKGNTQPTTMGLLQITAIVHTQQQAITTTTTKLLLLCLIANTNAEENTICQSEAACRTKFNRLNTGGLFYVDVKDGQFGCVLKGANGFWNSGGTIEEQSTNELPGSQERLYCGDDDNGEGGGVTTTTGTTVAATTTAASEEEEDEGTETPSYSPTKADEPEDPPDNANGDANDAATLNEDKSIATTSQRLSVVGLVGCVVLAGLL